jgi:hypothetical protein
MYKPVVIVGFIVVEIILLIVSWKLALLTLPFIVYYSAKRKPWEGEPARPQNVNRNYRLPLSRVRIPRMRIKR